MGSTLSSLIGDGHGINQRRVIWTFARPVLPLVSTVAAPLRVHQAIDVGRNSLSTATRQLVIINSGINLLLAKANSYIDGGGFLGHMVWTVQDDGTAAIPTALNHVTNLINGIAKGRRYASVSGGGKTIEICNFLGEKRYMQRKMSTRGV
ncbi:ribosomal protein L9 [Striga asiatica]|uniref:Ribosomal protein L9 n=1 Tax=Striga asiatica TaxID=4170 RepID=A0A5A7RD59_STRAF|nr:ribosomal protein L9 [Striga asiatica]